MREYRVTKEGPWAGWGEYWVARWNADPEDGAASVAINWEMHEIRERDPNGAKNPAYFSGGELYLRDMLDWPLEKRKKWLVERGYLYDSAINEWTKDGISITSLDRQHWEQLDTLPGAPAEKGA